MPLFEFFEMYSDAVEMMAEEQKEAERRAKFNRSR